MLATATTPPWLDPAPRVRLFQRAVEDSYAHNSRIYRYFADEAPLADIVRFLHWDAVQPPFSRYLQQWVERVPEYLSAALAEHIAEEVDGQHSHLFGVLMANLMARGDERGTPVAVDHDVLAELNYTFSPRCAAEQDYAFFAGSFYATEVMSAKRCQQLWQGLTRHDLHSDGRPRAEAPPTLETSYLELHAVGDCDHGEQVMRLFVQEILLREPHLAASLWDGIQDRLSRSATYLRWYEARYL